MKILKTKNTILILTAAVIVSGGLAVGLGAGLGVGLKNNNSNVPDNTNNHVVSFGSYLGPEENLFQTYYYGFNNNVYNFDFNTNSTSLKSTKSASLSSIPFYIVNGTGDALSEDGNFTFTNGNIFTVTVNIGGGSDAVPNGPVYCLPVTATTTDGTDYGYVGLYKSPYITSHPIYVLDRFFASTITPNSTITSGSDFLQFFIPPTTQDVFTLQVTT